MTTPDAHRPLNSPPEDGIGDRIRQAREKLGLSQARLAEKTKEQDRFEGKGIPRSVLIGYEAGKHKPGARELRLLCDALDLDVAQLLYGQQDLREDIDSVRAAMHAGMRADLAAALRVGFSLMRLKPHERDAFGSLIFGMVNKTFKTEEAAGQLWELAELLELDVLGRLLPGESYPEAASKMGKAILTGDGLSRFLALLGPQMGEAVKAEPKLPKKSRKSD